MKLRSKASKLGCAMLIGGLAFAASGLLENAAAARIARDRQSEVPSLVIDASRKYVATAELNERSVPELGPGIKPGHDDLAPSAGAPERVSPIEPGEPAAWQRSKAELEKIEKTGARHSSGIWGTVGRYLNPTEAEAIDQVKAARGDDWAKVYKQTKGQGIEGASGAEFVKGVLIAGALVKTTPEIEYLEKNYPTATAIERGMGSVAGIFPLIAAAKVRGPSPIFNMITALLLFGSITGLIKAGAARRSQRALPSLDI